MISSPTKREVIIGRIIGRGEVNFITYILKKIYDNYFFAPIHRFFIHEYKGVKFLYL
jgi:hypothetical protein